MKKILLLAATGAIGSHLVNILCSLGYECTVTSRSRRCDSPNLHYICVNAKRLAEVEQLLRMCKWDAIIDFLVYTTSEFKERINALLDSTLQYFYLSSCRIYADSAKPITEHSARLLDVCHNASFLQTDDYALAKARQEDLLRSYGRSNWTIVRPYITFGPNRLFLGTQGKEDWLYRAMKGRAILFSEEMINKETTLTRGMDVGNAIAALIGKEQALGEDYNLTTDESVTWRNVLHIYLDELALIGINPKVHLISRWQPCLGGDEIQALMDRNWNRIFDNSKIKAINSSIAFAPIEQALRDSIRIFLKSPSFQGIVWSLEAQKDRLSANWTAWGEIYDGSKEGYLNVMRYMLYRFGLKGKY